MDIKLRDIPTILWKRKNERNPETPIFAQYIGKAPNYYDILATIKEQIDENPQRTILFDGEIPFVPDFELIQNLNRELDSMDVSDLIHQEIFIFPDEQINFAFLESLQKVVNIMIQKNEFLNRTILNNFIAKMILFGYEYLRKLSFQNDEFNKCIYFGEITKHEKCFLILLHEMSFDVVYLNPYSDSEWDEFKDVICMDKHAEDLISAEARRTFEELANCGTVIHESRSTILDFENEITNNLFTGTGVYRPWQFKDGSTESVFFNSTLIDLDSNFFEKAKVRNGFKVKGKVVFVPHFFVEIEGVTELGEYYQFVQKYTNGENTFISKNPDDVLDLFNNKNINDEKYSLLFCLDGNGEIDPIKIKQDSLYKYGRYNDSTENFIIGKINEVIKDSNIFQEPLNTEEILDLIYLMLCLNENLVDLIDGFDFTDNVPKIIIFLPNQSSLNKNICFLLAFLNKIGFDILIFSPAGKSNLSTYINPRFFNSFRLESLKKDLDYASIENYKKKENFLHKIFSL